MPSGYSSTCLDEGYEQWIKGGEENWISIVFQFLNY